MNRPDQSVFVNSSRMYSLNALKYATHDILGKFLPVGVKKVVELGCGNGFLYRIAPSNLKEFWVGYDNHFPSLEVFKQLSPEAHMEMADITKLDLPDNSVDVVTGFSAFPLFRRPDVAKEVKRILRPGGCVFVFHDSLITDPNGENDLYSKQRRVEDYHLAIEQRYTTNGWLYKAGVDLAEAVVVSPYLEVKSRIPDEVLNQHPEGSIILATSRDIGFSQIHIGTIATAEDDIKKFKAELGNPRFLTDVAFTPGEEITEVVRMRYLVAEKRAW